MAGQDEMRTDATLTWNLLRVNLPTIFAIAGVGLYINNGLRDAAKTNEALATSVSQIQQSIVNLNNMEYRLSRAEDAIKENASHTNNLSNTMINNVDLIRRDMTRLTTNFEVFAAQIRTSFDLEGSDPKQRRTRPGGPIPVE